MRASGRCVENHRPRPYSQATHSTSGPAASRAAQDMPLAPGEGSTSTAQSAAGAAIQTAMQEDQASRAVVMSPSGQCRRSWRGLSGLVEEETGAGAPQVSSMCGRASMMV